MIVRREWEKSGKRLYTVNEAFWTSVETERTPTVPKLSILCIRKLGSNVETLKRLSNLETLPEELRFKNKS